VEELVNTFMKITKHLFLSTPTYKTEEITATIHDNNSKLKAI
jgi:hypothetical protein